MKLSRIENKAQFDEIAAKFKIQRFLFVDGGLPSEQWEPISKQQRLLLLECQSHGPKSSGNTVASLLVPSQILPSQPSISVIMEKNLNKLIVQFNALGLLTCCRWMSEVFRNLLLTFAPDASEEYTLQALMEDFQHEVFSIVLQQETGELMQTLETQENPAPSSNRLNLEKDLVRKREALLVHLENQKALLVKIVACLEIVTQGQSELLPLKAQVVSFLKVCNEPVSSDPFKNQNLNTLLSTFAKNLNAALVFTQ